MEKVYIIWQEDYPDDNGYSYDKSVHKVFGSKQEAEDYLQYAKKELSDYWDEDEDCWVPSWIYSLTEHRFGL